MKDIEAFSLVYSCILKRSVRFGGAQQAQKPRHRIYERTKRLDDVFGTVVRFCKLLRSTENELVASLVYIDRLLCNDGGVLNPFSCENLVFATLVLAIRYSRPEQFADSWYAKTIGTTAERFNRMLLVLLRGLSFVGCGVSEAVLVEYKTEMRKHFESLECKYCHMKLVRNSKRKSLKLNYCVKKNGQEK